MECFPIKHMVEMSDYSSLFEGPTARQTPVADAALSMPHNARLFLTMTNTDLEHDERQKRHSMVQIVRLSRRDAIMKNSVMLAERCIVASR